LYFNSTRAFDKHRTGQHGVNRRCMSKDEMLAKGMVRGADDFWRGSAMPDSLRPMPAASGFDDEARCDEKELT
jgi:hypothetical protein